MRCFKILRCLVVSLVKLLLLVVIAMMVGYQIAVYLQFKPYVAKIQAQFAEAARLEQGLPDFVEDQIIRTMEPDYNQSGAIPELKVLKCFFMVGIVQRFNCNSPVITNWVARQLMFLLPNQPRRALSRGFITVLWTFELQDHFEKAQILKFYEHSLYMGKKAEGLSAGAQVLLTKQPSQLTQEDIFYLLAISHAPSLYTHPNNHDRLQQKIKMLKGRFDAAQ